MMVDSFPSEQGALYIRAIPMYSAAMKYTYCCGEHMISE